MTEVVTIIIIMHYDDQAGLASVWLVPREVTEEFDNSVLAQVGTLLLGPAPYENTQQLEAGLVQFLASVGVRVVRLLWGDD